MTDPELEDLLRGYRPAAPPTDLRARVLGASSPVRRTWPWAAAAAALLVATVGLHTATLRIHAARALEPAAEARAEITALSEALGGGTSARALAEHLVLTKELDRLLEGARRPDAPAGDVR